MIRQKDRLVERYLDGRMTPAEERQFRHQLEEDEGLVGMLRTELLIRSTMAGEQEKMRADHSRSRARAMALLATMPRSAGQTAAVSGTGSGGALSGLTAIKGMAALLVAAAVAVGSYVALLPAKTPADPPVPASRVERAPYRTQVPPQPASIPVEPPPAIPDTDPTVEPERPKGGMAARSMAPELPPEPKRPARTEGTAPSATLQEAAPKEAITPEQPAAAMQTAEPPPVTIRNDTLRTRLKIEPMQRP